MLNQKCYDKDEGKSKDKWFSLRDPTLSVSHDKTKSGIVVADINHEQLKSNQITKMNSTLKGRKSLANCQRIASFESQEHGPMTADNVVFAFQMPLPKKGMHLEFSRWQQNLIGVLSLDIEYEKEVIENSKKSYIIFTLLQHESSRFYSRQPLKSLINLGGT